MTLSSAANDYMPPTPMPTAQSAIARFHRDGAVSALSRMRRSYRDSPYWGETGTPAAGWANAMVGCFETYIPLAEADTRPAFAVSLNREATFGNNEIGVHVDVVLLDDEGYVGRVVLWDTTVPSAAVATHYAAPVYAALGDELGEERVIGIEIWHLRSGLQTFVSAGECLADYPQVERLLDRITT